MHTAPSLCPVPGIEARAWDLRLVRSSSAVCRALSTIYLLIVYDSSNDTRRVSALLYALLFYGAPHPPRASQAGRASVGSPGGFVDLVPCLAK